ncbi:MAG: insulinase family protein [Treponema sp.]|nr:insulinase family protein [Treponema sp.]
MKNIKKNLLQITITVVFSFVSFSQGMDYKSTKTFFVNDEHLEINQYTLKNGIPVYIADKVDNQVDAVYLVVEGGTSEMPYEYSGVENCLFEMLTKGSKKYPYPKIQQMQYENQSSISHYTMYCGSVLNLTCINYYLDEMIDVMLDGFLNPLFDEKEFNILYSEQLQSIQHKQNDPESILFDEVHKKVYEGNRLLTKSSVTPESLENISVKKLRQHHKKILNAYRIKVVAVGKMDTQKFLGTLDKALGKIKYEKYERDFTDKPLNLKSDDVVLHHKAAAGSEIAVRVFSSPPVTSEDYVTARIAEDIYSTIMFNIIREKYGACYTPGSSIDSSSNPVGIDYALKVSDMDNIKEYLEQCEKLMLEGRVISSVDADSVKYENLEDCLEGYINSYLTKKYMSQASSGGIASRLTASLLQFGDITSADRMPKMALSVTKDDILRVFKEYWCEGDSRWFFMRGE